MPNRLANETSPYLLQHAENPVDWYPWGEEALARATREEKPIFLSVGYSSCHWCHVMEHESFESEAIAAQMNDRFVCVKVDREERPDLDQIYMQAVQMMNGGRGGWPMSVFLTPDLKPFYGGTYWPAEPRMGMPGFPQVLDAVHDAWVNKHDQVVEQAGQITAHLAHERNDGEDGPLALSDEIFTEAAAKLQQSFDGTHGGFGGAPKFPHATDLQLLLRIWRRLRGDELLHMVKLTLDKMYAGGMYDHLGGGFARYAVDARWLVPHFEKMLYDNASLANAYLDGYLVTGLPRYARVVRETLDYVLRDMTDETGGFHSAEDADSEGVEGKFYVWSREEVLELLGQEKGERFCYVYDVTENGNFEGHNILNLPKSVAQLAQMKGWNLAELEAELAECRSVLLAARAERIRPGKDDKILVSWNGLMIDAMARAAGILSEPKYLEAAQRAAGFIVDKLRRSDGRLLHTYRAGEAKYDAFLDDYTHLINGLISLYEADFDERWIDHAVELIDYMVKHFVDKDRGGFFFTADDAEQLIARKKDLYDSSTPSGAGMAAMVLTRLGKLCGRADYLTLAGETLDSTSWLMQQSPTAAGQLLIALDAYLGPFLEIVVVGEQHDDETAGILSDLRRRYIPNKAVCCRADAEQEGSENIDPIFIGKTADRTPTAYVCEKFTCQPPIEGRESIESRWLVLEVAAKEKARNLKQSE